MYFFIIFLSMFSIVFTQAANVYVYDNHVGVESNDGIVQGVQMTLTHDSNFEIELTEDVYVGDYETQGNTTVLILATADNLEGELFSYSGEMMIVESVIAMFYQNDV